MLLRFRMIDDENATCLGEGVIFSKGQIAFDKGDGRLEFFGSIELLCEVYPEWTFERDLDDISLWVNDSVAVVDPHCGSCGTRLPQLLLNKDTQRCPNCLRQYRWRSMLQYLSANVIEMQRLFDQIEGRLKNAKPSG
jgi:hypothetical protein